ncbi:type II secretory pathway, ATPase PulE/Tfp pilus assembly pathway, ATPase PilB [Saprospira grandis DSM 2844]|uniref:Type II secretory pathway, ATPase PulE/Tfp pilus assembly pathway, ATPase PilB n=1 Tax=Saprospira grandis DSM 2844 TaxID=694433 RepID=J0XSC8_9BACT|nr:GspE/PulE family protein [Saprospira grandis]EJF51811.1 type II secretory pathway, ATPase PulE/Tfp pilus assembly pathway, ATPase PilB [Saprospira grandis DSM 2844]
MIDWEDRLQQIDRKLLQRLSDEEAWRYQLILFKEDEQGLHAAVAEDQSDLTSLALELELLLGQTIQFYPLPKAVLQPFLGQHYRRDKSSRKQEKLSTTKDSLLFLLLEAEELGSSDIHFEVYEKKARIRLRIDGELIERYSLEKKDYPSLINKIKIKAQLDIAEKRLPQDGRIFLEEGGQKLDIRVSVLPTLYGEKVVMRLLRNNNSQMKLEELGFDHQSLRRYQEGMMMPEGLVLISGPTGSGKTTTLYASLHQLNTVGRNIITIEDPIEYTLEGINQVQLKEAIGLDFASSIRSFMRQDPNVIMVGEIRDRPTAEMAIRASLTGHLVFSTIHTNSAWGIVARLVDMGVPAYLLADTLNTAVAQRLVRLLCPACKQAEAFRPELLPYSYTLKQKISQHYIAKGCAACNYTGYKGRKAIYEVIRIDEDLAQHIKNKSFNVKKILQERGVESLAEAAIKLLVSGESTIGELYPILAASS